MARPWIFRSGTNLILFMLGFSGVGYYMYGAYNQRNFTNPVVAEAVKILGKNQKVKEMIGYPLSYKSSTRNKYHEKGNEMYFDFKVMGPRGKTDVEVTATKLKAKEVYEYDREITSIKAAESKYLELQKQLEQLQATTVKPQKPQPSKSWFGGSKKVQQAESKQGQQIQVKLKEVELAKRTYEELVEQRKQRKNQYYIPEIEYYSEIISQAGKTNDKVLPEQSTLYKLENIACQLPNQSRINILNSGKAYKSEDYQTKLDNNVNFSDLKKPLFTSLHQKLAVNVSGLSEEEIEMYSKHKTSFMYEKYGQYRTLTFICLTIGSAMLLVHFSKNKIKPMSNSVMCEILKMRVNSHPKISTFLKANKLRELNFDKTVGGGIKNNLFNCRIGINNVTMGRIEVDGKYNDKAGNYDFSKILFKYVENNQHKQIDLLK